jgi:hypothetical protein
MASQTCRRCRLLSVTRQMRDRETSAVACDGHIPATMERQVAAVENASYLRPEGGVPQKEGRGDHAVFCTCHFL